MPPSQLADTPEWKRYLALGEALLNKTSTASQVILIQETLEQLLGAQTRIWLARPYFPLPGEEEVTLLDDQAPAIVHRAYQERQIISQASAAGSDQPDNTNDHPCAIAAPLITQDFVLGVILAERGRPFRKEEINFLDGLASHAALNMQISRQVVLKNWRFDQLSLVRSVSTQIANVFNLEDLCQQVSQLILESFNYYSVSIYTLETTDKLLQMRGNSRQECCTNASPSATIALGTGMIGYTAQSGLELIAQDVSHEERYRFTDALPETMSEASFPLRVGAKVVGVLDVQMDHIGAFHEIDIMVLRALADNIALAVEGTRLVTDLRFQAEKLQAVSDISHALSSILDFDELMEEVVQAIHKRFGYPYVHLFTIQPVRRKINYVAGTGERSRLISQDGLTYNLDDPHGLIPIAAREGKNILVNDISQEPNYRPSELPPYNTRAEMVVPLIFKEDVLGVLDIQSDQVNAFSESDLALIDALGAGIAVAIRNATLYRTEIWRRQVADSFRDVATLLSANIALEALLNTILSKLENILPCEASAIWLLNDVNNQEADNGHQISLAAIRGVESGAIINAMESHPDVREWLNEAMSFSEPTIRTPNSPYGPLGIALNFPVDYSSIAVPLHAGDQLLGLLTMAHHTSGRYGSESRAITTTFASYAAVAIQNARLYAATQEQAWISTVLLQVAEASQAIGSIEELLETMVRLTPLLVGVNKCAFFLWDEDRHAFELSSSYGMETIRQEARFFDADLPAFARLRSAQSTIFIQDAVQEIDMIEAAVSDATETLVLLPLMARGDILGAFLVSHQASKEIAIDKTFNQLTLSILQGVAHQTAVAVENIHLLETRQEEAYVTAVLLQVAQAVVSQSNLNDILDTIVHLMPILVGIDACVIYLWDRDENLYRAVQAFTGSMDTDETIIGQSYRLGDFSLLDAVHHSDAMVISPQQTPPLPVEEWPRLVSLAPGDIPNQQQIAAANWLMGFPLSVKGEMYGVLVTQEAGVSSAFHERRLELVNGVAQQVALAIQNERLKEDMVRSERLEREIQLARQIQQTFLPGHLPTFPNWELDIRWQTARQVGGDFYDIFKLSKGRLGIVIADVSDKGLPAALYMTVTRTLIRAYMNSNESPARVLEKVNNLLLSDAQNGMFVTAIYAILALETGQLTYANAGHNRPYLLRSEDGHVEQLPKGSMALGVMEDIHYQDHILTIQPCDTLMLYTDGLSEAFSAEGETFGEERIKDALTHAQCANVKDLLENIDATLSDFRKGNPPSDDLTVVAIRRIAAA